MYIKIETKDQIDVLAALAQEIWQGHFSKMMDEKTLKHLIKTVQSKEVILKQISEGYLYYFIEQDNSPAGYFAYKIHKAKKELFLSKIYLLPSQRGKGLGREVIESLQEICKKLELSKITLTVLNKNVGAVKAYEKLGFDNMGVIERDFGNNIKFNDYAMEKKI